MTRHKKDELVETSKQGKAAEQSQGTRPICLSSSLLPDLPSKKITMDSTWKNMVARFEKKNMLGEVTSHDASRGVRRGPQPRPSTMRSSEHLEAMGRAAQAWMEAITGRPFQPYETRGFARNLKSGQRICELVNAIRPGTISEVHDSHKGFEQIENIEYFLAACGKLGVPNHALVDPRDIYEMKDTVAVVACVHALGSAVQASCPAFQGPHLGVSADRSLVAALPPPEDEDVKCTKEENGTRPCTPCPRSSVSEDSLPSDTNVESAVRIRSKEVLKKTLRGNEEDSNETSALILNMQDVARPSSFRWGFNTTVGTVSDLHPPAPLSARARKMCPKEVVYSPRALVYDMDPIGHPARSPTVSKLKLSTSADGGGFFQSASGTDVNPYDMRGTKARPSGPSFTGSRIKTPSPSGLWAAGNGPRPGQEHLTQPHAKVCPSALPDAHGGVGVEKEASFADARVGETMTKPEEADGERGSHPVGDGEEPKGSPIGSSE
ncbi:unnamed protein product [Ascophyllum nodosum]